MMAGSKVSFNEVAVIKSKVARNKKAESKKTKKTPQEAGRTKEEQKLNKVQTKEGNKKQEHEEHRTEVGTT